MEQTSLLNNVITFLGQTERTTFRVLTGWHTFDRAFVNRKGDIGFPARAICECSGYPGVGKSTTVYALSGICASQFRSNIAFTDLEEHFDADFMGTILKNAGFSGSVYVTKGNLDHESLEDLLKKLNEDDYSVGIVDSIGAISPVSESEGGLEDSNMGRRAMLVGKLARKCIKLAKNKGVPVIAFATNHVHQNIGSRGTVTSGGVTKDYLYTTRLRLSKKETYDDGSFVIGGKVDKNSFGYSGKPFYLFNLAGWGIHPGLTAVWDCLVLGLAKEIRVIKLGDKSFGYMKGLIKNFDDQELFDPFHAALKGKIVDTVSSEAEDEQAE